MFFLCLKIFFARIIDVSIGTIRMMFIVKGNKLIAAFLAFVEILVWFYAAREALNVSNLSLWVIASYAGGYATGTLIGAFVSDTFITGVYSVQVISSKITHEDILEIKKHNFGVSVMSSDDNKKILLMEINKKRYKECIHLIRKIDKNSFIIVNDSKIAYNGFIKK